MIYYCAQKHKVHEEFLMKTHFLTISFVFKDCTQRRKEPEKFMVDFNFLCVFARKY
jgi:hypothetical protein